MNFNRIKNLRIKEIGVVAFNVLLYNLMRIAPIDNNLIVLESEGDLSDNAFALYSYMMENGFLEKYRVAWLVDDVPHAKKRNYPNTEFFEKDTRRISLRRARTLATCKWYIYDHVNVLEKRRRRKGQSIIYLTHGCTFKARKGIDSDNQINVDEMYITGKLFTESMAKWANCDVSKIVDIGYPRLDYLFQEKSVVHNRFINKYNLAIFDKVFIWMPTFRKSNSADISEEYLNNETGLPIVYSSDDLKSLNDFLKDRNSLCILKLHHLQADYPCFENRRSNLLILKDADLRDAQIQLYQLLSLCDAMITDYSSVGYDYLLLNRPLIYTLDDLEEYKSSRGLTSTDILSTMAGRHCYTLNELESAIAEVVKEIDLFRDKRAMLMKKCHSHIDGNASKRILDHLGIYL